MKNSYERNKVFKPVVKVRSVLEDSIAEEVDIEPGDKILSINSAPVQDELDFMFLTAQEEILLEIEKDNNEIWEIEIEKDEDEDLGIVLEDTLDAKTCQNNCVFCFIDQMPPGMRSSLYVKDDDERLSFLTGNYITLTNLSDYDIDRICNWKIPINVSIHTTNKDLRTKMLRSKGAGDSLAILDRFNEAGVKMNAQIVLVPEYNDNDLINTLRDLTDFYPNLESVSVVPVGLTKYRDNLTKLRKFSKEEAKEIVSKVDNLKEEFKDKGIEQFVFLSDEFYLLSDEQLPDYESYGRFEQLENGVGMIADFNHDFIEELNNNNDQPDLKKRIVVTGNLAKDNLIYLKNELKKKFPLTDVEIIGVNNNFFGKNITVSGLLTGKDIIDQLSLLDLSDISEILMPDSLIRNGTDILLDDYSVEDLENILRIPIKIVPVDGKEFYKKLIGETNG